MPLPETLLDKLSSKPKVGGLQISDSGIQYLFLDKDNPIALSLSLPPGVIKEGKIESPDQLLVYLRELHRLVSQRISGQTFKVVVSLPASIIYTQSFSVPKINEERLEEAARLNLQIISPIEAAKTYMGWQVIGETEDRYDLLGAFADKNVVEKVEQILAAAGFEALIFEFPTLALTRAAASSLRLPASPVIILQVSSDGLGFSIIKGGSLYFEYFQSWRSIQGEAREITRTAFQEAVTGEVKKVINFSLSRFKENINQVLVVAPGFEGEIADLLQARFGLQAAPLSLKSYALKPNWYVVLGSAIRGRDYGGYDKEINLSSRSLKEVFYEERLINFIRFWRNIVIGTAAIILVVFGIGASLLVKQSKVLTQRLNDFQARISQSELTHLKNKVDEFNYLVKEIERVKNQSISWQQTLASIKRSADKNSIILEGFSGGVGEPFNLSGRAPSTAQVLKFKNVLIEELGFFNVNLPLAGITTLSDNSVGFSVSFEIR